ncbi:chitooligosaccharidolytic beta-N-acetylglucosaminidase isoform X2 [Agrilus planipennis]|uniref:Beta-hexosaminidase n=1 Tax=Agrilus planipennis TaxID=224129 RepID=A0A1W4XJ86_AGRPL|nr:chitooligosaccharidolytic beta-N-acetylglucosaminidase isoform X2 [Agrilus planipennis]
MQKICDKMKTILLLLQVFLLFVDGSYNDGTKQWSWICNTSRKCEKVPNAPVHKYFYNRQEACRLICGQYGALWPRPTKDVDLSQDLININPSSISFQMLNAIDEARDFLIENTQLFLKNIFLECGKNCSAVNNGLDATVFISISNSNMDLNWSTNESYSLEISKAGGVYVTITAPSAFGARHALETLSQLITSYKIQENGIIHHQFVIVSKAVIKDKPQYPYRGLLLDTARNFLSVHTIKRQINAMASSKLNVLHWHITDSQSFPLESVRVPQLSKYGSYSSKNTYSLSDVSDIIRYAKLRGIRVILEIDAPSHSGNGWQWGREAGLGDLAVCVNQEPWRSYCIQPPCGQLNPINSNVYSVLGDLYSDIVDILPKGETFHMGGDEVFIPCWNSTLEIVNYLDSQGQDRSHESFLALWSYFQQEALKKFDSKVGNENTPIVLWSSALTEPEIIEKYLSKNRYIIETWVPSDNDLPTKLVERGYNIIVATKDAWYLDHGFWGTTEYHNWRKVYQNRILNSPSVLGGEACMWGEYVDDTSIDSKVWPRAAAMAERLWSDPSSSTSAAEARFYRHRERLVARGIQADAVTPRWCYQNEGMCS